MSWLNQFDPNYVPQEPILQYKGIDPQSGQLMYYQIDVNGFIVKRSSDYKTWVLNNYVNPFPRPSQVTDALTEQDQQYIMQTLVQEKVVKPKTEYILFGDEPDRNDKMGAVNLSTQLSAEQFDGLKKLFTMMPRRFLKNWFDESISPNLEPKSASENVFNIYEGRWTTRRFYPYENMVWAAFIDVFNQANLEYVNRNNLEPWVWEDEKTNAYYLNQDKKAAEHIKEQLKTIQDIELGSDPQADEIMKDYASLPRLGDLGLEINRQNSINGLLKMREYELAKGIIDAYRYANDTELRTTLVKPIPFDVTLSDGTEIKSS